MTVTIATPNGTRSHEQTRVRNPDLASCFVIGMDPSNVLYLNARRKKLHEPEVRLFNCSAENGVLLDFIALSPAIRRLDRVYRRFRRAG